MEHEANIEFKDDIENLAANESLRSKPSSIGDNERLFAVLYTSGSTGKPKGARILHKSALNRLKWQWTTFPYRSDDVCVFKVSNIQNPLEVLDYDIGVLSFSADIKQILEMINENF